MLINLLFFIGFVLLSQVISRLGRHDGQLLPVRTKRAAARRASNDPLN